MTDQFNQKNIFGNNQISKIGSIYMTRERKQGFVLGVLVAVVAEIIIRLLF